METKRTRQIDRLIHWLVLAEIVVGIAIALTIVYARCTPKHEDKTNIHELRDQHEQLQLRTLEDSVSYFEDGF